MLDPSPLGPNARRVPDAGLLSTESERRKDGQITRSKSMEEQLAKRKSEPTQARTAHTPRPWKTTSPLATHIVGGQWFHIADVPQPAGMSNND